MELKKIIHMISDYHPVVVTATQDPVYIQTHKMIKPGQTRFYPQCLYVGYVSELGAFIDDQEMANLICIEDQPLPEWIERNGNLNLILMEKTVNQFDVLNRLADIMIDEAGLIAHMRQLLDALYANRGLQYMVDVAAEVFGNPMFVNDIAYRILAYSKSYTFHTDPTLEIEKELGYIHEENLSALRRDKIFDQIQQLDKPFYSRKPESQMGFLFRTIKIHDVDIGLVALVESNQTFRTIDYELLERFSKLIAIEMEKSDFYKVNKGVMFNFFLADLINDRLKSKKIIDQRLALLHWKVYDHHRLFVVTGVSSSDFGQRYQRLGQEIRQIIPDCRWTIHERNLIVFFSRPTATLLTDSEESMLRDFLQINHLSIGISAIYSDILLTPRYYRQALKAAQLGLSMGEYQAFYYYSDLIVVHISQILDEKYSLNEFCHPAIEQLKQYDNKNKTVLYETLREYLRYVNDPVAASAVLNIHRNTLLYRINKIKELTGLSLMNGDENLLLQLTIKFDGYNSKVRQAEVQELY